MVLELLMKFKKVEVLDYEDLGKMLDWEAVNKFRHNALNPDHPVIRGTSQNPDIYFQGSRICKSLL